MIVKPNLTKLLKNVDSRYTLISVIAKRSREITGTDKTYVEPENANTVTTAANELAEGLITYKHGDVKDDQEEVDK